jgi:hypothetical protein
MRNFRVHPRISPSKPEVPVLLNGAHSTHSTNSDHTEMPVEDHESNDSKKADSNGKTESNDSSPVRPNSDHAQTPVDALQLAPQRLVLMDKARTPDLDQNAPPSDIALNGVAIETPVVLTNRRRSREQQLSNVSICDTFEMVRRRGQKSRQPSSRICSRGQQDRGTLRAEWRLPNARPELWVARSWLDATP